MPTSAEEKYADIIHLPNHRSPSRPHMSNYDRAAQFSPFAALTGYDAAVDETARLTRERTELDEQGKALLDERLKLLKNLVSTGSQVNIIYFQPDLRKYGGEYLSHSGSLRRIDPTEGSLLFADGFKVAIDDIYDIDSPLFTAL